MVGFTVYPKGAQGPYCCR